MAIELEIKGYKARFSLPTRKQVIIQVRVKRERAT